MILVFWMLSFKPTFSLSSFTFINRLFSFSSLSAVRVVSSAYLRLFIFLPEILIPACASSSPTFLMMYSTYKLNKQGDNIQPWHTPFPIWNHSVVSCEFFVYFEYYPLLHYPLKNIFPHWVGYIFGLLIVSYNVQIIFSLIWSHLFIFHFVAFAWGDRSKKILLRLMSKSILSIFFF